jgi:hypothetical protein
MLLLLLDSLLLVFITFSLGSIAKYLLSKWFATTLQAEFIEVFLLGLIISAVYFDLLSFIMPVNYLTLIPLLLVSGYWQYSTRELNISRIHNFRQQYLSLRSAAILFSLVVVLIVFYCLSPPYNVDSPDYHYQSTYWAETLRIIPGLGNVHGRLAFNAASFILSAPYSFSRVFNQSIYPLNGVLVLLFYVWLFRNIIRRSNNWSGLVYFVTALLFLRPLLANIPSPASEPLVTITVAVVFFRLIEIIRSGSYEEAGILIPLLCISFFALTAKLTSLPVLLVPALCIFFLLRMQRFSFYVKLFLVGCMIMIPWLARNVVLSGYLVYPLYYVDLFSVDWKVPKDVAYIDYALGTYGVKGEIDTEGTIIRTSFNWFLPWIQNHFRPKKIFDFFIFVLCFSSPLVWFIQKRKQKIDTPMLLLWLCAFAGAVVWLFKAPEYRFGMSFLLMSFAIPMLGLAELFPLRRQTFQRVVLIMMPLACMYYMLSPMFKHSRVHTHGMANIWLRPMRDKHYYDAIDMTSFRYTELGNGVKLFYGDKYHHCYHIKDQPCMPWYYGIIELRGKTISSGFRNVSDETRKTLPWLFFGENGAYPR